MHDPRLSYICMSKDSLLQCMHEAAVKHDARLISSISVWCQTKLGFNFIEPLWYGRSWPRSQSERGKSNLEWKKNTFILSSYNELVDILSSGRETPRNQQQIQSIYNSWIIRSQFTTQCKGVWLSFALRLSINQARLEDPKTEPMLWFLLSIDPQYLEAIWSLN